MPVSMAADSNRRSALKGGRSPRALGQAGAELCPAHVAHHCDLRTSGMALVDATSFMTTSWSRHHD